MLTSTALDHLRSMASAHREERWDEAEVVCDGIRCYLGERLVSRGTVAAFLRHLAVSEADAGGLERYAVNATGLAIADRPEVADEVLAALAKGLPFTLDEGRVVPLDDPSDPEDGGVPTSDGFVTRGHNFR